MDGVPGGASHRLPTQNLGPVEHHERTGGPGLRRKGPVRQSKEPQALRAASDPAVDDDDHGLWRLTPKPQGPDGSPVHLDPPLHRRRPVVRLGGRHGRGLHRALPHSPQTPDCARDALGAGSGCAHPAATGVDRGARKIRGPNQLPSAPVQPALIGIQRGDQGCEPAFGTEVVLVDRRTEVAARQPVLCLPPPDQRVEGLPVERAARVSDLRLARPSGQTEHAPGERVCGHVDGGESPSASEPDHPGNPALPPELPADTAIRQHAETQQLRVFQQQLGSGPTH